MRLSEKTALVTGAASGIGSACATLFKAEGARVAGVDVNPDGLAALGDTLDFTERLDITDKAAVDALVASVASAFGRIDILVNCAGITARHVPDDVSWDDTWQRVMDVNVKGTLLITHAVMDVQRRAAAGGAIVNLSSIYGHVGRPPIIANPTDPYPHSKATVLQMTRDMAVAGAPHGIRVNALCPGFINTPLTAALRENTEVHAALLSMHPLGRLGAPEEVARCALFLASDDASFVTGTSLAVDGGYLAI